MSDFPFIQRHEVGARKEWQHSLAHVQKLQTITRDREYTAQAVGTLVDYELRLALVSVLLEDTPTAQHAIARGAGAAHAAVLSQRYWHAYTNEAIVQFAETASPRRSFTVDYAGMAAPDWLKGLSLAMIARDTAAINTLAAAASIDACWQPTTTIDAFWEPYCKAFAATVAAPQYTADWVDVANKQMHDIKITEPDLVRFIYRPALAVMLALTQFDAEVLNQALFEAVQAHQHYYAMDQEQYNWNGLFSPLLTALSGVAHDRELPIFVHSDYLPDDLIAVPGLQEHTNVTLHYPIRTITTAEEAHWFLDLEGIPRAGRQHMLREQDGQVFARYESINAKGFAHTVADFTLADEGTINTAGDFALDIGELLLIAEMYSSVPAATTDKMLQQRADLEDAIHAVELALQRLPKDGSVPQLTSKRGQDYYDAEPERFRRDRLQAYHGSLQQSLAALNASMAAMKQVSQQQTAPTEAETRASALLSIEIIRAQVMPLLKALAHDTDGELIMQIKPREEDYTRVFLGVAADVARETYTALWETNPPKMSQIQHPVEVRCFVSPAGMLREDNELSRQFPQGYRAIAHWLNPNRVWIAWKYIKTGQSSGQAFNGLVWVDDHWAWFPKPFRALGSV